MVVATRAQARKHLEEEILRKEKQVRSQVKSHKLEDKQQSDQLTKKTMEKLASAFREETGEGR